MRLNRQHQRPTPAKTRTLRAGPAEPVPVGIKHLDTERNRSPRPDCGTRNDLKATAQHAHASTAIHPRVPVTTLRLKYKTHKA